MSYIDVLNKILDSKDVTVGGGSASALGGSMAAGLIGMVVRLSTGKEYGLTDEEYLSIADELDKLSKELLDGSQKDTEAYLLIRDAFRLPKSTDEEKEIRKKAINDAGVEAALVPKSNGEKCKRVYEIGEYLEGKYNENAGSDFVIGKNLASLGLQGCIMNIEANLSLIKDEKIKEQLEDYIKKNKK